MARNTNWFRPPHNSRAVGTEGQGLKCPPPLSTNFVWNADKTFSFKKALNLSTYQLALTHFQTFLQPSTRLTETSYAQILTNYRGKRKQIVPTSKMYNMYYLHTVGFSHLLLALANCCAWFETFYLLWTYLTLCLPSTWQFLYQNTFFFK